MVATPVACIIKVLLYRRPRSSTTAMSRASIPMQMELYTTDHGNGVKRMGGVAKRLRVLMAGMNRKKVSRHTQNGMMASGRTGRSRGQVTSVYHAPISVGAMNTLILPIQMSRALKIRRCHRMRCETKCSPYRGIQRGDDTKQASKTLARLLPRALIFDCTNPLRPASACCRIVPVEITL